MVDSAGRVTGSTEFLQDITGDHLAGIDALTSLPNRRSYETVVDRELRTNRRLQRPVTLATLDVDRFKKYNDQYGHPIGDVLLQQVGARLAQNLRRPTDHVFRMGGDEFGLLFSSLDIDQARTHLDTIRRAVKSLEFRAAGELVSCITVSIGAVTAIPTAENQASEFYEQADAALYFAKQTRNCVQVNELVVATHDAYPSSTLKPN